VEVAAWWVALEPRVVRWTPWWLIVVGVAIGATAAWDFVRRTLGYRQASPEELAHLQQADLWHVTAGDVDGFLDPSRCRPWSRTLRSDRFLSWPARAVFVFDRRPGVGDVRGQVRLDDRGVLYRLDGSRVTIAYVRRDGCIALPSYTGSTVRVGRLR